MQIFHGTENANIEGPTVLTLGVFDGLHLGHQAIMQTVVSRADNCQAVSDSNYIRSTPKSRSSSGECAASSSDT